MDDENNSSHVKLYWILVLIILTFAGLVIVLAKNDVIKIAN